MRLIQALRNQTAKIAAELENSKLFDHMGDRGSFRECIIKEFLRPFLPDCYGLSSGEIFSVDGDQSAQVDIVVYDAVFSTVLFRSGPLQLFPAESVFGAIEIKSDLSRGELDTACQNVASVKRLERPASDMLDFLPFVRPQLGAGLTWDQRPRNPYLGCVFGYRGIPAELVAVELNRRLELDASRKPLLPDFVFVAQPGYMVARCQTGPGGPTVSVPGNDFDKFMYLAAGGDTLPLFFVTLNLCLHQLRLRSIDYQAICSQLTAEIVGASS